MRYFLLSINPSNSKSSIQNEQLPKYKRTHHKLSFLCPTKKRKKRKERNITRRPLLIAWFELTNLRPAAQIDNKRSGHVIYIVDIFFEYFPLCSKCSWGWRVWTRSHGGEFFRFFRMSDCCCVKEDSRLRALPGFRLRLLQVCHRNWTHASGKFFWSIPNKTSTKESRTGSGNLRNAPNEQLVPELHSFCVCDFLPCALRRLEYHIVDHHRGKTGEMEGNLSSLLLRAGSFHEWERSFGGWVRVLLSLWWSWGSDFHANALSWFDEYFFENYMVDTNIGPYFREKSLLKGKLSRWDKFDATPHDATHSSVFASDPIEIATNDTCMHHCYAISHRSPPKRNADRIYRLSQKKSHTSQWR